jgi:hypothetical protein
MQPPLGARRPVLRRWRKGAALHVVHYLAGDLFRLVVLVIAQLVLDAGVEDDVERTVGSADGTSPQPQTSTT